AATETIGDVTLPCYRGDIINGPGFDADSRTPDPERMLQAHRQSKVTQELLRAFSAAAYADLDEIDRSARERLGLPAERRHAATGESGAAVFPSHEGLLLNYEQALTRWDEESESWWATSGHLLWIGDRTRQLDGAHVEFASGVRNSIGLKCGPALAAGDLFPLAGRPPPR